MVFIKGVLNLLYYVFGVMLYASIAIFSVGGIRKTNIWIFGYGGGSGFRDNSRSLYEYTHENVDRVEAVWLTRDTELVDELKSDGYNAFSIRSLSGIYYNIRAERAFITHSRWDICWWASGGIEVVNLTHGIPYKKYRWSNSAEVDNMSVLEHTIKKYITWNFHYAIAPSKPFISTIAEAENVNEQNILVTGLPKYDSHYKQDIDGNERILEYIIDQKSVFYFPTWREGESVWFEGLDLAEMDRFLIRNNINLLIVPHKNSNEITQDTYDNIWITDTDVSFELILNHVDLFITDYSSITYDALKTDTPIIYYPFDYDEYISGREFVFDYDYISPGPKVYDQSSLTRAITDMIQGRDKYHKRRMCLIKELEISDSCNSNSSKSICEYLNIE